MIEGHDRIGPLRSASAYATPTCLLWQCGCLFSEVKEGTVGPDFSHSSTVMLRIFNTIALQHTILYQPLLLESVVTAKFVSSCFAFRTSLNCEMESLEFMRTLM